MMYKATKVQYCSPNPLHPPGCHLALPVASAALICKALKKYVVVVSTFIEIHLEYIRQFNSIMLGYKRRVLLGNPS